LTPKWYSVWSNPFLPAAFQFPRAFLIAGPTDWALKMCLFLQIFREHNPIITWPDDPLHLSSWFTDLDMTQWHMVVKPKSFLDCMASGVIWSIPISRWANWHDMAHQPLEDAEMSVTCTRYLDGDPPPWDGANLRHGALVIDIIDKSGVYVGTSHGGTIFDGLARTAVQFGEDFIDSTQVVITDTSVPPEYYQGQTKLTMKQLPYVVFREGHTSPIQTSAWINSPAKGIQVNTGGHSMPGVNETISATIQAGFDMLGSLFFVSSLGATVDTMLKPLYEDTVLAWWSVKNGSRAINSGWERLFEYFQQGANKAYCVSGDTVINGPDGDERIDTLAERGGPFRVWSITPAGQRVTATAAFAFKKGHTELFRFTLDNGAFIKATRNHRWFTPDGWRECGQARIGTKVAVDDAGSLDYSSVIKIEALGCHDFYDMHVPRLENYLAQGIWNHNTIASLMVLRAGFWATKTTVSWKVKVSDGLPFMVGDRGLGHFFLDDRIGLVLEGDTQIHMDRARKLELVWSEDGYTEWDITVGDERIFEDPAQRAWGKIEQLIAGLRDLGVY